MVLGEVLGRVVSTVKHHCLKGRKLLIVQCLDAQGKPDGVPIILLDFVGAGKGDRVIVSDDGISTREEFLNDPMAPQRSSIIAIINEGDTPRNFKENSESE